jgi:hypothetical protein
MSLWSAHIVRAPIITLGAFSTSSQDSESFTWEVHQTYIG